MTGNPGSKTSIYVPDASNTGMAPVSLDGAGVWAAMSHEIRTPLMGVVGMLEILSRTSLTDEQRRIIATAGESSLTLMHIVDDVLDLAKMEASRLKLMPVVTDLVELLEGCTETLANQNETKNLAITCEAGFDVPPVLCDALRLRQVILNLGNNAIKFTETGQVALTLKVIENAIGRVALRFTIADSGIGIPPELHAFLFQPFSQLAASSGRGLGGVGLGLAICRNLIDAMRGEISVESTLGQGTRFHVDVAFPIAAAPAQQKASLEGLKIVAVDAGEPALQIAMRYLEGAGARVQRVTALSSLMSAQAGAFKEDGEGSLVIIIGPDAEPEDVEAVTTSLQNARPSERLSVLWLHPRALGGGSSLARRGVRTMRAHPLRRGALLTAVAGAHPVATQFDVPPLMTRRVPVQALRDDEVAAIARAEGRIILVAEDNLVNQQVLRQQLAILGFDCDMASSGIAALQALRERRYLLLLCDCHMPGMDGFELTRLIRAGEQEGTPRIPIIAITANAMPGEAERCRAVGMDDYLAKPIEIKGLQTVLGRWIAPEPSEFVHASTQRTTQTAALDVIDLRNLRAVFGDDPARLKPVLDQWRNVIEDASTHLRHALAATQWDEAASAVHRIKGSAGIAGAHRLSAAAVVLEDALRISDASAVAHEGARVLECTAAALREVAAWTETLVKPQGHGASRASA